MTGKQLKEEIRNATRPIDTNATWYIEHYCREMIDSLLAYNYRNVKNAIIVLEGQKMARYNYLDEYIEKLGEKRVLRLIEEQINDIVRVDTNVLIDDEGLSYNAIIWKDDE